MKNPMKDKYFVRLICPNCNTEGIYTIDKGMRVSRAISILMCEYCECPLEEKVFQEPTNEEIKNVDALTNLFKQKIEERKNKEQDK